MNDNTKNKKIIARIASLSALRKKILSLPPEKVLSAILDSPQSIPLVHSFPEEDFYFLIHDIGVEDSLPLLQLASYKQWEYIIDLEVWKKDRIELSSVTRWFDLLLKADSNRFIKWFLDQKTEFFEFYLFKNIEVKIRETDQDPSEFSNDFFTYDETFYIRFLDDPLPLKPGEIESETSVKKHRDAFLTRFLKSLSAYDHVIFQKVLLETAGLIPAETEEDAYRLKNVRLAEKGFLPYEEAIGIYQPLKADDFNKLSQKFVPTDPDRKIVYPVPFFHARMLGEESYFTSALKKIGPDGILEQIQIEFVGLCNRIISADQKTIRERDELKSIVKKACGYINIGLEELTGDNGKLDAGRCAALIRRYPLSNIFRVGFGLALDLKWRAERWQKESWFKQKGLLLAFWDEKWMGILGGLLLKKPLFFDNYKTGSLFREFVEMEDIKEAETVLNEIIGVDKILSLMDIEPDIVTEGYLTYKNFILTLWARHYLGISEEFIPLTLNEFRRLFKDLWTAENVPRQINPSMKESFLNWLSGKTGLTHYDITQHLGKTLENLFNEIKSEYGEVSEKDLDPRYIHLFFIKKAER